MRLRNSIKTLIDRRFETQTALADFLNPMPEGMPKCKPQDIQRLASAGRNLEKQFTIFLKLMPLFVENDLVSAYELLPSRLHERRTNLETRPPRKTKTAAK